MLSDWVHLFLREVILVKDVTVGEIKLLGLLSSINRQIHRHYLEPEKKAT